MRLPAHAWALAGAAFRATIAAPLPPQPNLRAEVPLLNSRSHNGFIPSLGHHVRLCKQPVRQAPHSGTAKLPTPAPPCVLFTSPEPLELPPGPASSQATPPQSGSLRSPSALGCEGWVLSNDRGHSLVNRAELGSSPTGLRASCPLCCVAPVASSIWFPLLSLPSGISPRPATTPPTQ